MDNIELGFWVKAYKQTVKEIEEILKREEDMKYNFALDFRKKLSGEIPRAGSPAKQLEMEDIANLAHEEVENIRAEQEKAEEDERTKASKLTKQDKIKVGYLERKLDFIKEKLGEDVKQLEDSERKEILKGRLES